MHGNAFPVTPASPTTTALLFHLDFRKLVTPLIKTVSSVNNTHKIVNSFLSYTERPHVRPISATDKTTTTINGITACFRP